MAAWCGYAAHTHTYNEHYNCFTNFNLCCWICLLVIFVVRIKVRQSSFREAGRVFYGIKMVTLSLTIMWFVALLQSSFFLSFILYYYYYYTHTQKKAPIGIPHIKGGIIHFSWSTRSQLGPLDSPLFFFFF